MGPDTPIEGGFPEDGDEFQDGPAPAEPPTPPAPPAPPQSDPLADMRARMERLERENADIKRLIPPAAPKTPGPGDPPVSAIDQIDWDKELFANPKATIAKAVQIAKEETARELRAEYQRDNGTRNFWDKFYQKHPDLREDHDLVEVTLNSNLSTLANIRVEDAYDKLAELTRDRILRYTGGAARRRPKAVAEGGGGTPTPPQPAPEPAKGNVSSLSSFLRDRRTKRRAGAA